MKVDRKAEQEAIVYLTERINISNSGELKNVLQDLCDENYKTVAIDFTETKMIDSSCLGRLLMFQKKFRENNGELVITNVTSDYIKKMFKMIHLNKVISIVEK